MNKLSVLKWFSPENTCKADELTVFNLSFLCWQHNLNPRSLLSIKSKMDLETSQTWPPGKLLLLKVTKSLQTLINSEIDGNVSGQDRSIFHLCKKVMASSQKYSDWG
jgi:hypothetical protein